MDTRWKKFSQNVITKALVYLMLFACITAFCYKQNTIRYINAEVNAKTEYLESDEFKYQFQEFVRQLLSFCMSEINGGIVDGSLYETLNKSDIFEYGIKYEKQLFSNTSRSKDEFRKLPFFVYYDQDKWFNYSNGTFQNFDWFNMSQMLQNYMKTSLTDILSQDGNFIAIGMKQSYYESAEKEFSIQLQKEKNDLKRQKTEAIFIFIIGIICFSYLAFVTGKRTNAKKVTLNRFDSLFLELQIGLCFLYYFSITYLCFERTEIRTICYSLFESNTTLYLTTFYMASSAALFVEVLLSQIRKIRANKFAEKCFCIHMGKRIITGGNLMLLVVVASVMLPLLCLYPIFCPFVMIGCVVFGCIKAGELNAILEGVKKIKTGELGHKIKITGKGRFRVLADHINTISAGFDEAVNNEVKSERLKTELISNVSHDIKTPLTSIITYVDLLKQEKIESEKAREYIDVLERKSRRLKVLTTDLFEAAKATSGSIRTELGKVELGAFIQQGLGEFDDKIQAADLEIKLNLSDEMMNILADGRLMWRVFENLMSNIIKYALRGSRVYIHVEQGQETITLIMKNISAYELNISAGELLERFTRGDASRNSEGSGLGLNIARSLVELQHGKFELEVDGDLFKAKVTMPKWKEE